MFESKIEITLDNDSKALIKDLVDALLKFSVKLSANIPEEEKTFDMVGAEAAVEQAEKVAVALAVAEPIAAPAVNYTRQDVFRLGMQKTAEGKQAFAVLQKYGVNSPNDLPEEQINAVCAELEAL